MIRNLKVVLLWLCIAAVALSSSGMIRQSVSRQTQKPVRGVPEKSVQTKSDGIKPTGKTPKTATGQPVIRKQNVQPQSGRSTTVASGGPSIHIISPTFGVAVQGSVNVTGFVDNLVSGLSSVTVNGNTATIDDQRFTATVTGLTTGQTQLIVNASDGGGNNSTFTQPLTVDTDSPVWANVSPEGINARWIVVDPSNPQTLYTQRCCMNIIFPPEDESFIKAKVEDGLYSDATELIRDAVRRLREQDDRRRQLGAALELGEADIRAGRTIPYTPELLEQIEQEARLHAAEGRKPNPDVWF